MCLKTQDEFNKTFNKIFELMTIDYVLEDPFQDEAGKFKWYDKVLEICVHTDIIYNEASEEAIEYVYNMKRNTEKQVDKND